MGLLPSSSNSGHIRKPLYRIVIGNTTMRTDNESIDHRTVQSQETTRSLLLFLCNGIHIPKKRYSLLPYQGSRHFLIVLNIGRVFPGEWMI